MPIVIRKAHAKDAALIFEMLHHKAELEGLSHEFSVTPSDLAAMIKRGKSTFLIAEYNGKAAALANYHYEDSTFTGKTLIMLDDLYTAPAFGGQGIAKAVLAFIAQEAMDADYALKIAPLLTNPQPLEWYKKLGARAVYDAQILRIDDVQGFINNLNLKDK